MRKIFIMLALLFAVSFVSAKEYVYYNEENTDIVYVISNVSNTSRYIKSLYEKHNVYREGQAKKRLKITGEGMYIQIVADSIESESIVIDIDPVWIRMNNLGCNVLVKYNKSLVGTMFETYHAYIITENTIEAIHYRK